MSVTESFLHLGGAPTPLSIWKQVDPINPLSIHPLSTQRDGLLSTETDMLDRLMRHLEYVPADWNCKQPGHESNGCPQPRTTETKQCYHCQGVGHVQADCPTLRLSGAGTSGVCYSCGQPGHLAVGRSHLDETRSCPSAGIGRGVGRGAPPPRGGYGGGFRGNFSGGPRSATCYKCGGPNHYARDCQAQAMKCYACGKLGHISRDCTAPNGGPLNTAGKTCYRCGEAGHISRDCPQTEQNGEAPAPVQEAVAPAAAPAPVAPQPAVAPTAAAA
ncbi:MAG: hypothetical protein M1832_001000 [Thelocarpon impressellum]|nr:MAG: hypothetical protein M1832_001000 [Thelocarpon impressellum]